MVPAWVKDIESFRRWSDTPDFPQNHPVWWLNGEIWIDMAREQLFTHLALKGEYYVCLGQLVAEGAPDCSWSTACS